MKNNESLTVKFTKLTKTQKETLQQMFAYVQKCTKVGANRSIGFFWDAGWGMEGEVSLSEESNCAASLDSTANIQLFFDLSEGTISIKKIEKYEGYLGKTDYDE